MNDKIKCPNCAHQFDVEEALSGQIRSQIQKEYEQKAAEQAANYQAEKGKLASEREEFEKKKAKENELFKQKLEEKLKTESEKISKETQESFQLKMQSLNDQLDKRKEENRLLQEKEINFLKKERLLVEEKEQMELTIQKRILEQQEVIEEKVKLKEREASQMKEREYQKQLDDQKKLIEEMKRKAEQGSMQMQGEVQELALEELLGQSFPFDLIDEVPKGINGADVIQTVRNHAQVACGTIVYESKRTKNFEPKWIEKLKQDQVRVKGDIAVLVTATMPKGQHQFDIKDGVDGPRKPQCTLR